MIGAAIFGHVVTKVRLCWFSMDAAGFDTLLPATNRGRRATAFKEEAAIEDAICDILWSAAF